MSTGQLGTVKSRLGLIVLGAVDSAPVIIDPPPPTVTESNLRQDVVTMCWPNRVSQSVLSGGSWRPSLPLANLQNQVFAKKARSTDASTASTRFRISLDKSRPIAVLSLAAHTITQNGTVRAIAYTDSAASVVAYDSGAQMALPASYLPETLEWEDNNFWFGEAVLDVGSDYTPLVTLFFSDLINTQVIDVIINDTGNPDGYVDIGRCFIATAWQPAINMSYGVAWDHIINTKIDEADDGTEYFDRKRPKRRVNFNLGFLTHEEAFLNLYAMQRDLGIDREILITEKLMPTTQTFLKTFIGRLAQPDPISQPYFDANAATLTIQEII